MKIGLVILIAVCGAAAVAQTPPTAEPRIRIFGRVVDADTREPVRRADIKIYTSKEQWDKFTDGEGRFQFELIPREYGLAAHRDGYTDRTYIVERSDFDHPTELPVELHRQGLIAGKAVDGSGIPLQGAMIEALSSQALSQGLAVAEAVETNDLGEYRLAGLDPGTYQVRATYREGRSSELDPMPQTISTAYYGGSDSAGLAVKSGGVLTGIDFVLSPARLRTIRGTLRSEREPSVHLATLWIMGRAGEGGQRVIAVNGAFEIDEVVPGSYTISAETLDEKAAVFGVANVEVRGEDVDNIDILLRPMPKILGEIRTEGGSILALNPGGIYFMGTNRLVPLNMKIPKPDGNGMFSLALVPGEYTVGFDDSISKLGIRSVTLDGEPITDWKLHIAESPLNRKLVIVVGAGQKP